MAAVDEYQEIEYRTYIRNIDDDWTGQTVIDGDLIRRFFGDRYGLDRLGHFFIHEIKFGENNRHFASNSLGIKNPDGSWQQRPWNHEFMTFWCIDDDSKKERYEGFFAIWTLQKYWSASNNEYSINGIPVSKEDFDKWLRNEIKFPPFRFPT